MKSYIYEIFAGVRPTIFWLCLICFLFLSVPYAGAMPYAAPAKFSPTIQQASGALPATQSQVVDQTSKAAPVSNTEPMPAKVMLKNGTLTVQADNSDLSQILREIAAASGMRIDGSVRSVRVYGSYGPSNSRNVLTDLLQGLGYNFIMVGVTNDGAPRELTLTPRTGGVTPPSLVSSAAASSRENPDEDAIRRGAILHVPPPPPDDPQERMQQHLRQLQQMRDLQASQNQP